MLALAPTRGLLLRHLNFESLSVLHPFLNGKGFSRGAQGPASLLVSDSLDEVDLLVAELDG